MESAVPPRPKAVRFLPETGVSARWWLAAWAGYLIYVDSTADPVPPCDGSECPSSRDWELATAIFLGAPLTLAGVALSAGVIGLVVATANRRRWPTGLAGTAVTGTAWLVLAGMIALRALG
ncbi:hypothetical protein [Actinoplanes sp. NPDC048796]|uniref:hypothetical protein n=1 Tax=unclassified Actinoplanes TaxID=2626549 RepID=UPI0033F33C38